MARVILLDSKRGRANTKLATHRASASEGEAVRRLLEDQGFPIKRVANKQLELRCPFHEGPGELEHGKGTKFYVNAQTSTYLCHAASCGERGNLQTLEAFFGVGEDDSFVIAYRSREEQLRGFEKCLVRALRTPFYEHGLTDETIERFRLGYEMEHLNDEGRKIAARYVIPYLEGRRPRWFRYYQPNTGQANYDERWKYTWEEGANSPLFNAQDAMGDKDGLVFLAEGEQKAMLLVQLGYAAVAVPGAGQWKDEFQAAFTHARHIVVCYDNDNPAFHNYDKPSEGRLCNKCAGSGLDRCRGHNPGQDAALARVEQLGWRAKNVLLPMREDQPKTDINDFFMRDGGTNADFAELATGKRATPFKVASLTEISASPPKEATFLIEQGILPAGGRLLVAGKAKVGKEARTSTPVLTPHGWTTMGALRPGDEVIGANGMATAVVQIHPQGIKPIYRVTMSDGSSTECGWEHLWNIQTTNDRTYGKKDGRPRWRTVTTEQIAGLLAQGRERDTYIPMVAPVQYAPAPTPELDPYGLGLLLGDGSFRGATPSFSKPEPELHEALAKSFPDQRQTVYNVAGGEIGLPGRGDGNVLTNDLRALSLWGCLSIDKFIPESYLRASIADRLAILQGLLDTDGWVQWNASKKHSSAYFGTSSERLKDDVVEIVESLGGQVRVLHKPEPKFQTGVGKPAWSVRVRLPEEFEPFRLTRKLDEWRSGRTSTKETPPVRRIVSVDYVDDDEAVCITVANLDGLYVTDHFIVTHNSLLIDNMALSLAAGIPFLGRFHVDHPTRTLLLDRELSKWSLFDRLNKLIESRPGYRAAMDNMLIDHDHLIRLDQATALDTLLQLVEQNGAEVLILDTAYKFFSGDVESSSTLMKAFEVLDKVLHQTGCSIVLTHHIKKGQGGKPRENTDVADPDSVAGSYLWTGWPNATILLNYLNRSVENPYNSTCTFTAFRDAAAPEPLALYRNRESIAYSAIQDFTHADDPIWTPVQYTKPTTEAVAAVLLEMCPTTEADFLHAAAAKFGTSMDSIKPFYLDALSIDGFEKTTGRPPVIKYRYDEEATSWDTEHGLAQPDPNTPVKSFEDVPLFAELA